MHAAGEVLCGFQPPLDECLVDDDLRGDVRQFTSLPGFNLSDRLEFLCIRSTPSEMQSMSENDFECLKSTGVKAVPDCC
jgi:hypothetical protein